MSTTGTYTFDPENADIVTEAFDRIGVRPDAITGEHITSAMRSMAFCLMKYGNLGLNQYKVETFTLTPSTVGQTSFTLNTRVIRIATARHRRVSEATDTPMYPVGRSDYDYLHKKTTTGNRPDRYFLDRQRAACVMYVYPAFDNITDTVIISALVKTQDVGSLSDTPDVPWYWLDLLCSSMATRLAEKYAVDRLAEKALLEKDAMTLAIAEHRETADTVFTVNLNRGQ